MALLIGELSTTNLGFVLPFFEVKNPVLHHSVNFTCGLMIPCFNKFFDGAIKCIGVNCTLDLYTGFTENQSLLACEAYLGKHFPCGLLWSQ